MVRRKIKILNPTGLHLRPAGIFCNTASNYKCKVMFEYNDMMNANAKSVLSVLGACIKSGDEIVLICDGEDEEEAMRAMVEAIEGGLGE
ncbi:HPr family phosphocarrier protein [Lachnospiraceae bacterium KGMB03038]|nr:HPr family phosphocarrier protein [Lachnospiraceae bacterium KGMB03038]